MSVVVKNSAKERDNELLVAVAAGDRLALEELYLNYHRRLARFYRVFTPRYENVEEIINDTFMVVWQCAKDFRYASQVSTWIIGIAYRTALKSVRRQKNHTAARSLDEYPEQTWTHARHRGSGLAQTRAEPAARRTAFDPRARLSDGPFARGNRGHHPMSVGTVKARMFHAREKLRLYLPNLGGTSGGIPGGTPGSSAGNE